MKKGITIPDITIDLDARPDRKPAWVYFDESQIKLLCDSAKYKYKVLIWFLYDSGIRSPVELSSVKVSDLILKGDYFELDLKRCKGGSFLRKIKLVLSTELVKEFIEREKLQSEEPLFNMSFLVANKYIKRLAESIFGDAVSLAGEKYKKVTLYDFRHCSCCYWLPRYKSESALKYRFGWKKSDKIHYYSELLGMKDTISEEDIITNITKTQLEKKVEMRERENVVLTEKCHHLEQGYHKLLIELDKIKEKLIQIEKG